MRVTFADVAGTRTRFLHAGDGDPVLLVHGVGLAADSWLDNVKALGKQFTVVAPDVLDNAYTGAGPYRSGPPQPYMVEHLAQLADHLGFKQFSVIGSSLGASLATLLYLRMPQRITRLMLVGPGSSFNKPGDPAKAYEGSYINGKKAIENPTYENCQARMARAVFDPACIPEALLLAQMTQYSMPGALESFERRLNGLRTVEGHEKWEIRDKLQDVNVPVYLLTGREDPRGDWQQATETAKRLKDVKITIYEKCGHWPHLEHPDKFNQDAAEFLSAAAKPALMQARA